MGKTMRKREKDPLCQKLVQNGRVESDYNKSIIIVTLKLYIIIIYIYARVENNYGMRSIDPISSLPPQISQKIS